MSSTPEAGIPSIGTPIEDVKLATTGMGAAGLFEVF